MSKNTGIPFEDMVFNISLNAAGAILRALTEKSYASQHGESFFSLTGADSLEKLICSLL